MEIDDEEDDQGVESGEHCQLPVEMMPSNIFGRDDHSSTICGYVAAMVTHGYKNGYDAKTVTNGYKNGHVSKMDGARGDVKIICRDGTSIFAHSLILATASPNFLRPLLRDSSYCEEEFSILIIPDISREDLTRILDIVYLGETSLGPNYSHCLDLLAWLEIPLDKMVVEVRQKKRINNEDISKLIKEEIKSSRSEIKTEKMVDGNDRMVDTLEKDRKSEESMSKLFCLLRPPTTDLPIFVLQYNNNNNNNSSSSNSNNNHNTLNSFRPQFGIDKKSEINSILESEILTSQQQQQQQQQNRHQLLTFQTPEIKKEETEIPCSASTPPMFQNNVKIFNRDFFQQPLKSEIVDDNATDEIMYQCDLCGGKFQLLDFLKHQEVHVNDHPYVCEEPRCGRKFKTQSEFRLHRRVSHKSSSRPSTSTPESLSPPLMTNRQAQTFLCPKCRKSFKSVGSLKTHLVVHMGDSRVANSQSSNADNSTNGIFTCKICQTLHWSWNTFSKHFLKVHGTVPKIVLRYNNNSNTTIQQPNGIEKNNNSLLIDQQQQKCGIKPVSEEISHQDQFEYNSSNSSNISLSVQQQQQQTSILLTSSNNNNNTVNSNQQQQPPVLLTSSSLSISSSEIPFVIANHLSTLTPTNVNEPPSLYLSNNNNSNNNKQKWFVQSGEHINGRTCLGLSNKMDGKFHQIETDSQKSFAKVDQVRPLNEIATKRSPELTASIITQELSKLKPNNIENLQRNNSTKRVSTKSVVDKSIECQICKTSLKSAKSYKRHMDQCHSSGRPKHVCILCQRTFKRSDNLTAHYRSVHCGLKPNNCKCGKGYRTKNELLRHCRNSCPVSRATPTTPTAAPTASPSTTTTTVTTHVAVTSPSSLSSLETEKSEDLVLAEVGEEEEELDLSHGYFSDLDFEYDVTTTNDFIHF